MDKVSFTVRHKWDSRFWLVFLVTSWFAIAMGFGRPIHLRFFGTPDYPPPIILVIHVWSYFGWITLLSLQALLVSRGRTDLHRKLGVIGVVVAIFVTFSGFAAEVFSQRFYAPREPENIRFFMVPLAATIGFGTMALAAILKRRDSPAHKRLIFLATAAVMAGPYSRWWGDAIAAVLGKNFIGTLFHYFLGLQLMMAAAIAYDLATRGKVHRVYAIGVPFLLAVQVAASATWHSDWWPPVGRQLMGIAPVAGG